MPGGTRLVLLKTGLNISQSVTVPRFFSSTGTGTFSGTNFFRYHPKRSKIPVTGMSHSDISFLVEKKLGQESGNCVVGSFARIERTGRWRITMKARRAWLPIERGAHFGQWNTGGLDRGAQVRVLRYRGVSVMLLTALLLHTSVPLSTISLMCKMKHPKYKNKHQMQNT